MHDSIERLTAGVHDLLVVGAGIHGAWAAWDATLRGLSVAVIDQGEFGGATSANSLRIVHGGLRYLARGDLVRMRESIAERTTLLRIAPQFVAPLPVLVPTYRHRGTNRLALGAALFLNDILSCYRNRGLAADRTIPGGRLVSKPECRRLFPAVDPAGLTGGAMWYDGRLLDPEGLTSSLVAAAARHGAIAASRVRADRLIVTGQVRGARAVDCRTGHELEIRARAVLIAAGPWSRGLTEVLETSDQTPSGRVGDHSPRGHAFAINVRLQRRLGNVAVGLYGNTRYFFLVPDGESMLAGTWYALPDGSDERMLAARGTRALLEELNAACPRLNLSAADVAGCQHGWLPLQDDQERSPEALPDALAERPRIVDLDRVGGPDRVVMLEGVKFTTARRVAADAIDRVVAALGAPRPRCRTAEVPL